MTVLKQGAGQIIGGHIGARGVKLKQMLGKMRVRLLRPRQGVPQHLRRPEPHGRGQQISATPRDRGRRPVAILLTCDKPSPNRGMNGRKAYARCGDFRAGDGC